LRGPAPQIHLEQSILSLNESLGHEEIVLACGVDVRNAPRVAQDPHRRG